MDNAELKNSQWIVVLNDDDSFTGLDGCWIAPVADDALVLHGGAAHTVPAETRWDLRGLLDFAIDHGYFSPQPGDRTQDPRRVIGGYIHSDEETD